MSEAKPSGIRPPSKIGRPTCTVTPKPAIPPSPPRSIIAMEPLWEGRRLSDTGNRRGSDNSVVLTEDTDSFIIGDHVWVGGTKPGQIAYIGETQFAPGDWAGIVLDEPIGKNDGSVAGCRYFQCEPKRGIFSRLTRLTRQPISGCTIASPSSPDVKGTLNKSMSPSLNNSTTSLSSVSHRELQIGERVIVSSTQGSKTGVLRYMGTTEFASGEWCGVELDDPVGKNDGSIADKRYFECKPKHGLFAPTHKVSRSPSSRRSMCQVHRPSGAALNASLRKAGSRESLASVSSVASSIASRATTASSRLQKAGLPRSSTPAKKTTQDALKDRQKEIETLRKERDLERERVTKAASQADEAERTVVNLKKEYEKYREDTEKSAQDTQNTLTKLLEEKNLLSTQLDEERRKTEDLLFRFEEESINKDVIQKDTADENVANAIYESKIKDLEKLLSEERERVIQLERESTKLFEAEEELTRLRIELQNAGESGKGEVTDLQKRNADLEKSKEELEKILEEKNQIVERYTAEITEVNRKLKEKEEENTSQEESKSNLQKQMEEVNKQLREKNILISELQNSYKIQTENLEKEIEQLKEKIQLIIEQNLADRNNLIEEHEKLIKEKDIIINERTNALSEQTQDVSANYERRIVETKASYEKEIKELSESLRLQLESKNTEINDITNQLKEKIENTNKLSADLAELKMVCSKGETDIKKFMSNIEELTVKLKASDDQNVSLNNEISTLKSKHGEETKLLSEQNIKLESDVNNLTIEINSLKDQLNKLDECVKMKDLELSKIQNNKLIEMEVLKKQFQDQIEEKNKCIQDINSDVSRKSTRLDLLEKELTDLKSIIANKDEEIKNLSEKNSELRDALKLSEETKTNLESELRMYETNLNELNDKFSRAEEKISQLVEQKEKLETEITNVVSTSVDSSDKLVQYTENLRQREKELDEAHDKEFELQKQLTSAEMKINNTEQDLNRVNLLVDQLRLENDEVKTQMATEKEKNKTLSEKIIENEETQKELINKNKVLDEQVNKLSTEISDVLNNVKTLQETKTQLEKELSDLNEEHKITLNVNSDNVEKLNNELVSNKHTFDLSIKKLEQSLDAKNQQVSELETLINSKNLEIQDATSNLEKLKQEKEDVVKDLAEINDKFNKATAELSLLKSSTSNLESERVIEVSNLKSTLDATLKEFEKYKVELNKEIEEKTKKCEILEATIMNNEKAIQELKSNLDSEKENSILTKQNLESLHETIKNKENEVAAKINEITTLTKTVENLKTNICSLQGDIETKTKCINELETTINEINNSNKDKVKNDTIEKQKQIDELRKNHEEQVILKDTAIAELTNMIDIKQKTELELKDKQKNSEELIKKYEQDLLVKDKTIIDLKNAEDAAKKIINIYEEKQKDESDLITKYKDDIKLKDITIIDLQNNIKEREERMENFIDQINYANEKSLQLEETQKCMEKENKQLQTKYNEAVAMLNIANENIKNNTNNDISNHKAVNRKTEENAKSIKNDSVSESDNFKEEYELAKSQIEFLNSVIVDMQRKNEAMSCKIQVLEMGIPSQEADDYNLNLIEKKMQPPRMFCDICDQFDLHETEDCPLQAQDAEPPKPIKTEKKVPVQRPYCENCEVFGHDTEACEDTETY